jgi:hypothetical protein
MPSTEAYDASARSGEDLVLPVAADTVIYPGTLVARNAAGDAVPAADTAGLVVIGRAQTGADNTDGLAAAKSVRVRRGVFRYENSDTNAATKAHRNTRGYIEDDTIVSTDPGNNAVVAGEIVDVDDAGVWVDTRKAGDLAVAEDLTARVVALENP